MLQRLATALRRVSTAGWIVFAVVAVLVLGAVALLRTGTTRPIRPITIGSGAWSPFVGQGLDGFGPIGQLVTEVLERQGFEVTVEFQNWGETETDTVTGDLFGSFPFIASERRNRDLELSDPLIEFDYALFYRTGESGEPPRTSEDLADLVIGLADGYEAWPALGRAATNFAHYGTVVEAFEDLVEGEIDLVVEGLLPGLALIESVPLLRDAGIGVVEAGGASQLGSTETLHFVMPKSARAPEVMGRFNEILAEIKLTDGYRDIVSALSSRASGYIELKAFGPHGLVELIESDASVVYTPQGTAARVLQWPDEFLIRGEPLTGPGLEVTVQILDGPAIGRIVTVDARSVRLASTAP